MKKSSKGGFALNGKAKPAQFTERQKGQNETGFKQKTAKQVTAAMQGGPMPSGKGEDKWNESPRADARKQFGNVPGKAVF